MKVRIGRLRFQHIFTPLFAVYQLFFRHHHSADHVHHHHRSERVHAAGVLHQGGGHLPLGQLRLCLFIRVGVRSCQLSVHCPGPPRAQDEREGAISGLFPLHAVWCCEKDPRIGMKN